MAINYDLGSVSSYAIAVQHGFTGTIDDWVDTIKDASQVYDNLVGEIEDFANSIPLLDSTLSHNDQAANAFAVGEKIEQLKNLISAPQAASTVAEMTDTSKVYVYTGSEAGYVYGDWYYYDSTQEAWVDGGPYQSSAEGGGITSQEKSLILTLFSKAAYAEDDAGEAYDQLSALWSVYSITWAGSGYTHGNTSVAIDGGKTFSSTITASGGHTISTVTATMGGVTVQGAWNNGTVTIPNVTGDIVITVTTVQATVSSISAVYVQSGVVNEDTSLDSLKSDLVVTATYVDSTTYSVPADEYTLSGTLAIGTSTITVTYMGQTDTFTVTVTPEVIDYTIDPLDGITWYDGYIYDLSTGVFKAAAGEHCTAKFDGQNCIYHLTNSDTTNNRYFALSAWDENDNYLGYVQHGGPVFSLKKHYKYAIKVYNTATFNHDTLSFLPKDNTSTAVSQFSIRLSDYIGNISIGGSDRLELNVASVMSAAGVTADNMETTINKCNYLAIISPTGTTESFTIREFTWWFYNINTFMFKIQGVSSVAAAESWITANNPVIIFN